jgi:hypothetical protein
VFDRAVTEPRSKVSFEIKDLGEMARSGSRPLEFAARE